ncbi:MAG: lipoyl synthase [Candidatus Micrarchaeaceae archaeon]
MKPEWLSVKPIKSGKYEEVRNTLLSLGINTVCTEARCPNLDECWSSGTATFMVMGEICTRGCRFCSVSKMARGTSLDKSEPERIAEAVRRWGLSYVVITSVCRDDLEDQGSRHFAECIKRVKEKNPGTIVEVLIPDFQGKRELIENIIEAGPEVIGHNVETVRRLSKHIRDRRADYDRSIGVLKYVKDACKKIYTKSAIMLGLGERREEVISTMKDLRSAGVDFLCIGQYLRPSKFQAEVKEYIEPRVFEEYKKIGIDMGFRYVASAPFVRSSYKAGEMFAESLAQRSKFQE